MTAGYNNILVIKMSALGDVIQALPSLYMLRALYPKARITWLIEPQFADVLPDEPYINEKILFHKNEIKKKPFLEKLHLLSSFRRKLIARHFDLVIDLQGLAKSALVSLLSGCKNRIGYCEMREGSSLVTRPIIGFHKNGHVIERYRDVIRHLGATEEKIIFPVSPSIYQNTGALQLVKESGITGNYAVFFPGAGWKTKEWPISHFARLAKQFIQASIPVVIAGDNRDVEKGKKIMQLVRLPNLLDLTGKTCLTELFCLLKNAVVCVGGDTGPQHIAAAVGTPTVSLFGPSSWSRSYPMRSHNSNKPDAVICATVPCSPCFKRNCPKNIICMDTIGVEAVFEACKQYISSDKKTLPQSSNTCPSLLPGKKAHSTDIQAVKCCKSNDMTSSIIPDDILQKADKVLFILNLAIGDWCYLQNCFRALSVAYPNLAVHIWADKVYRSNQTEPHQNTQTRSGLFDWLNSSPFVQKVYETHSGDLYQQSIIEAKKEQYPVIISLATVHSHQYALFARNISPSGFIVGIRDKARFWQFSRRRAYNALDAFLSLKQEKLASANFHISERYAYWFYQLFALNITEPDRTPFIHIPDIWLKNNKAYLISNEIRHKNPVIFINAFAQDRKRSWTLRQVAGLIRAMSEMDKYKDAWFIFNAMPENVEEVKEVINQYKLENTRIFSATENFFQLPAMLSHCNLVITAETSIMHIATALGIPFIAMMRQKNPEWKPRGNKESIVITAEKRRHWVKDITVKKVINSLALLQEKKEDDAIPY
ncbi:MAG: hypothetical protein NC211_04590 [Alistipes senegalensis]|nr:hypothetical protein [Oxalobacter formigenes]MCM1281094.1 hypothetical protein [Alistipes senegalensis]